jgi:hypothetical protein
MRVGPISTLKGSLAVVNTTITISAITPDQYSSDTIKVSVTLSSSIQNGLYAVEGNNSNTADIWLDAEIY